MENRNIRAAIVDMDGVITRTAEIHAEAWKIMFDDFLSKREGKQYKSLDIISDYKKFIDGKSRMDGIRSFLASRKIILPEGSPEDGKHKETINGLGKRKNEIFLNLINEKGVQVYEDTLETLTRWKKAGIKLAVITSSKNGRFIMEKTGMLDMFEVMVDGIRSEELKLKGKPEPDIFLQACEELNTDIQQAIILEDAVSGVEGGKKGKFALVIGVARNNDEKLLKEAGADIVVTKLTDIDILIKENNKAVAELPDASESIDKIKSLIGNKKPVLFLDYDGTLTPIVSNPDDAILSDHTRDILVKLADKYLVAVISGRDRADVKSKVALENLIYAGSHGFDITGPDNLEMELDEGKKVIPDLDRAEESLNKNLGHIQGVLVERKKYAIAVHYRNVKDDMVQEVRNAVHTELDKQESLKEGKGKKVLELKPDFEWHKGKAIEWLKDALEINDEKYVIFFIGDDVTDEDAFRSIKDKGIGIMVGDHNEKTEALYRLKDTESVPEFLKELFLQ
jgi:trehalose 6-phosphate phosphatase